MKTLKVLFLCSGNTCRSPLTEALARQAHVNDPVEFSSAGLQTGPGLPASEGTLLIAAEHGIDLSGHRSRPLTSSLLEGVDWVVAMTHAQAQQFQAAYPAYRGRVGLLGLPGVELADEALLAKAAPLAAEEVRDPYGGGLPAYHAMGTQVRRLLHAWAPVFAAGPSGDEPVASAGDQPPVPEGGEPPGPRGGE